MVTDDSDMALTDTRVKTAKPKEKPYKLTDGGGMYLLVKPNGSKYWQYRFRLNNVQGTYQIGCYPDISLKKARQEHQLAREYVADGINPKEINLLKINTPLTGHIDLIQIRNKKIYILDYKPNLFPPHLVHHQHGFVHL